MAVAMLCVYISTNLWHKNFMSATIQYIQICILSFTFALLLSLSFSLSLSLSPSKSKQTLPFYIFSESYGGKMSSAFALVLQQVRHTSTTHIRSCDYLYNTYTLFTSSLCIVFILHVAYMCLGGGGVGDDTVDNYNSHYFS